MEVILYISAAVAILATILMLTRLIAVHALLYLVVSLLAVALVFYVIGAALVAALEVIIYAGAIIVLIVFVVMMLNLGQQATVVEKTLLRPTMWIGPGILAVVLAAEVVYLLIYGWSGSYSPVVVDSEAVGVTLYSPYLIGVELASMLLLAGLVGAYHLGWRRPKGRG